MKILVPVKRVLDANLRVRVNPQRSDVDLSGMKMAVNPFDEIALEEAVRLRESGLAAELVAVSCGPAACEETLRTALALGADRAILIETETTLQPLAVAGLLKCVALDEACDLILMGKQAIDDDANQTGQMLAAKLGWPQATFASQLRVEGRSLQAVREVDSGRETLALDLPAVVTADLRLNVPRFATLPNIMKARRKPLEVRPAAALGVDLAPRQRVLRVDEPVPRGRGRMLSDVAELARILDQASRRERAP